MIQVGLVGVGPRWERYRPALSRLRQPIHIEAVYDAVFARGETAAKELNADHIAGIRALAARGNVDAVLVMDPSWTNGSVLPLLARQEKPVFFAAWPLGKLSSDCSVTPHRDTGGLLVPAMWRRFIPTAIRLQELIATELGPPLEITIDLFRLSPSSCSASSTETSTASLEEIVGWLDFCRYLFRAFPVSATFSRTSIVDPQSSDSSPIFELRVDYPQTGGAVDSQITAIPAQQPGQLHQRTARLLVTHGSDDSDKPSVAADSPAAFVRHLINQNGHEPAHRFTAAAGTDSCELPKIVIHCEHGKAEIASETRIRWQGVLPDPAEETLTSERSKEEIMLDIFCRRVVGGLIPVADLSDILMPVQFLRSCFDL